MRSDLSEELAEFRREVKTVLDAALSETGAPLAVRDLKRGPGLSAPQLEYRGAANTDGNSCRICTGESSDLGAVDRELALLEQSNAALFTALARTRVVPIARPLPSGLDASMRSVEVQSVEMDRVAAHRMREEAAAIQARERRRIKDSRRLAEQNRDLRNVVSDLQRQKNEIDRQMEEKRLRREQRKADAKWREEKRRKDEQRALRAHISSAAVEADRLRAKLKARTTQRERARVREALWRWRASAAASVAARERRDRLAAEAMTISAAQEAERAHRRDMERSHRELDHQRRRHRERERKRRTEAERVSAAASRGAVAAAAAAAEAEEMRRRRAAKERAARQAATIEREREDRTDELASEVAAAAAAAAVAACRASRRSAGGDKLRRASNTRYSASEEAVSLSESTSSPAAVVVAEDAADTSGRYRQRRAHRPGDSSRSSSPFVTGFGRVMEGGDGGAGASARRRSGARKPHGRQQEQQQYDAGDDGRQAIEVFAKARRRSSSSSASSTTTAAERTGRRRPRKPLGDTEAQESLARLAGERRVLRRRRGEDGEELAKAGRSERLAQALREKADEAAAVKAGAAIATAVLGRARRRSAERAFIAWAVACREARQKHAEREGAFRRVVARAGRRYRRLQLKTLQRWRLTAAAAAMEALRQRRRRDSVEHGTLLAEALIKRRSRMRLAARLQQWRDVDAKLVRETVAATATRNRRARAVNAVAALLRRRRRDELWIAFRALASAARVAEARERREYGARVLAARERRASKALLLTRCWGAWKAFTAASRSTRRLTAAAEGAQRVEVEKRRMRLDGVAWACKAAVAAAEARLKARAWRTWLDLHGRKRAVSERVLLTAEKHRRVFFLRQGLRKWREACRITRAKRALEEQSQTAMVGSAFRGWARESTAAKVASLKKRQATLILSAMLRTSRRNALASAMAAWRSALVLAAGERQAARARKLSAARAVHVSLASAARASRRRAWLRWRAAIARAPAISRLQTARRAALQRCVRGQRLRDLTAAWRILHAGAHTSRSIVTGVARIKGTLLRVQRRVLSRRLGIWRSEALAGAIASGEALAAREYRRAGVRLLAATADRVERRRLASTWRIWNGVVGSSKRAEAERVAKLAQALVMAEGALKRIKKRELRAGWWTWREAVAERRLRGAVGAAKVSLEGEKAVLAAEVEALKQCGALRLISSILERSTRIDTQRGWKALRQASQRRSTLLRATTIFSRSRSQVLRIALLRWRVAATEARAFQARVHAGRSVLTACLAISQRRNVRPAWATWMKLIAREREKDDLTDHGEGLMRFVAVLSRVGNRRDMARKCRVLVQWRLRVARLSSAVVVETARQRAELKSISARTQVAGAQAGARLALRWLHRQQRGRQRAAWRQWTLAVSEGQVAQERENWRIRTVTQLARELARVVESRRLRILRRSMSLWHRRALHIATHSAKVAHDEKSIEAGARQLHAVLDRALLRRKARVWARLVGSAIATAGREERSREVLAHHDRLLAVAKARSSRRIVAGAWRAWKSTWVESRHRGEIKSLRAQRGAGMVVAITRRKQLEGLRIAMVSWRARGCLARERERAASRIATCLLRADARWKRTLAARCLLRWQLGCIMRGKAVAEEGKASAEAAYRAQAVLAIIRRHRLHRLGEAFRCLFHHKTVTVYGTRQEEARQAGFSRGLRGLGRMVARKTQRQLMSAFARWRWFAAGVGQQSDRALLVSSRKRAGAQSLVSLLTRRERGKVIRAWTLWRSGAASAAVHDGERASADLRVSGARHSAAARLLLITLSAARRRAMGKAWRLWYMEVREAGEAELQTMEKHFHLARMLNRVEKGIELESLERAWHVWGKRVIEASSLAKIVGRVRRSQLTHGFNRWRLTCHRIRLAEADTGRASAEAALRAKAMSILTQRRKLRQLREGFSRLFDHGAWVIYFSKEAAARRDRLAQGLHVLARSCARRRERDKLRVLGRWQRFTSERRRQDDRALLQATGRRAGAKSLAALVARRENMCLGRSWGIWRTGAASAAVHDGERASADQRVFGARRSAGARLLCGVVAATTRRTLTKAWVVWCKEAKAAADAELQVMEKHFHLARTLTRVERRVQIARVGRTWRAWRDVVRVQGEAELQTLERQFHVAQVLLRVARRAQERRLSRAWGLWARLAARGSLKVRGSLTTLSPGLLAAAHASQTVPARSVLGAADGPAEAVAVDEQRAQEQAERSRRVRHRAGAVTIRGLLRRADSRSLARVWQIWRAETVAEADRKARLVVGVTRVAKVFEGLAESREVNRLRRFWGMWAGWSAAEGRRLEHIAEADKWLVAEAKARELKALRAARVLAKVIDRSEARLVRASLEKWTQAASSVDQGDGAFDEAANIAALVQQPTARGDNTVTADEALGDERLTAAAATPPVATAAATSPSSGLVALRHKLLGGPSPLLPSRLVVPLDARCSPVAAAPRSSPMPRAGASLLRQIRASASPRSTTALSVEGSEFRMEQGELHARNDGRTWWAGDSSGESSLLSTSPHLMNVIGISATPSAHHNDDIALQYSQQLGTPSSFGSLDLSASPEQPMMAFRSHSAGDFVGPLSSTFSTTAVGTLGSSAHTAGGHAAGGTATVMTAGEIASPAPSLAYTSESPLLGESVLQSRSDIMGVGEDEDLGQGELVDSDGTTRERSPGDGQDDSHRNDNARPRAESQDVATGLRAHFGTPERLRSEVKDMKSNRGYPSGGEKSWGRNQQVVKSRQLTLPPYVPGSVHASPSGNQRSFPLDEVEEGVETPNSNRFKDTFTEAFHFEKTPEEAWHGSEGEEGGGGSSSDETGKSSAELFMARMRVVVFRQAFKRWLLVHRDADYDLRMMTARKKVAYLRRQQKLRKVVVSALRRQSYAWHVNDTSRAVRKWKEFVRRRRDDVRFSLEISRISTVSALSPLSPRGARAHTAGMGGPDASAVGQEAGGGEGTGKKTMYSSPFSTQPLISTRRRLWDQAD